MRTLRNLFLAITGLTLLSACSAIDIDALRAVPSKGTPFQTALQAEYTDLAYFEDELRGDWDDAVYYDKRARASAAGRDVEPETLKGRKIPPSHQAELEAARIGLVAALGANARIKAPKDAARAQIANRCPGSGLLVEVLGQEYRTRSPEHGGLGLAHHRQGPVGEGCDDDQVGGGKFVLRTTLEEATTH